VPSMSVVFMVNVFDMMVKFEVEEQRRRRSELSSFHGKTKVRGTQVYDIFARPGHNAPWPYGE